MVFVNSKKYACESCIKGHRSSSCSHTDRPLFEIKKKGRPVSQCEKCRQLRQSKKVHSKCNCPIDKPPVPRGNPQPSGPGTKPKRYIPTIPTLPNGLKDVLQPSSITEPADSRQRVETLLNPCNCEDVWTCRCRTAESSTGGLQALANAASSCCGSKSNATASSKHDSTPPDSPRSKRNKRTKVRAPEPGPELPPLLFSDVSAPCSPTLPTFGTIPSMSTMVSLAGTGCTCGVECACPGCVEHRGPEHASKDHHDCANSQCSHCVDRRSGIALPMSSSAAEPTNSILDRFFARAAALPLPPSFNSGAPRQAISLPKLECCGGSCGCPNGVCGCGDNCGGCCGEHQERPLPTVAEVIATSPPKVVKSCCSGKA